MSEIERKHVEALIAARNETAHKLAAVAGEVHDIARGVAQCLAAGGSVFACGNGGSATQATHFVAELVGRFKRDRTALRAFSLCDNPATVTALANDYGYDDVFAHQIRGLAKSGDCLLALSTSGNSKSVVRACRAAREREVSVFALTGETGGEMKEGCDVVVRVPFADTARVQEVHLMIIHLVCELVELELFAGAGDESA